MVFVFERVNVSNRWLGSLNRDSVILIFSQEISSIHWDRESGMHHDY